MSRGVQPGRSANLKRSWRRQIARGGLSLIEVAASTAILGVILTIVAQVLHWSALQHRATLRKRCALEAASTALDRLTLLPWAQLTSSKAAEARLTGDASSFLGESTLIATVNEERKEPRAKIISVEVRWAARNGAQKEHVRLSGWVFQQGTSQ